MPNVVTVKFNYWCNKLSTQMNSNTTNTNFFYYFTSLEY